MSVFTHEMEAAAARHLIATRLAARPGARLPESCRPPSVEAALAIQRRVGERLGLEIGGWKCSVPSAERKVAMAPIYAPTIHARSPCPILPIDGAARIEPEVAFVIGRDLPPRSSPYAESEVLAAIAEARLVLELIGKRFADPAPLSFPEVLADGIVNQGLFIGPLVADALDRPLEALSIAVNTAGGTLLTRDGRHPDGHPLRPLLWLANFLAGGGYGERAWLRAGHIVTTGSYCGVLNVPLDVALDVRFGDVGVLAVKFSATLG